MPTNPPTLTALIACGGQSRRMGTDKGLIPINGTCWAKYLADMLAALSLPVYVSINPSQQNTYSGIFDPAQLITDALPIEGPLNGLLSAHQQLPGTDLLLLACDMVHMQPQTLQTLITTYASNPGHHFYTYQNQQFAEPFCAIYTYVGLIKLIDSNDMATLSGMSLQKVLNNDDTMRIAITNPGSFKNNNTPI